MKTPFSRWQKWVNNGRKPTSPEMFQGPPKVQKDHENLNYGLSCPHKGRKKCFSGSLALAMANCAEAGVGLLVVT